MRPLSSAPSTTPFTTCGTPCNPATPPSIEHRFTHVSFVAVRRLGPDDQVWLLNQVKADRMTVGEAVVVAKQGPPSVSRARRAQLQREADRKRGELHTQHALAAATTAAVYVSVVRVATAELIRLEQAATVIQTAALVYCARQQAQVPCFSIAVAPPAGVHRLIFGVVAFPTAASGDASDPNGVSDATRCLHCAADGGRRY